MSHDALKATVCPNCGGDLDIDYDSWKAVCQSCGSEFQIKTSEEVKAETVRSKAYKEVEEKKLQRDREREQKIDEERRVNTFKSGKLSKVIIAFAIICGIFCALDFGSGHILSAFIALIQTVLFALAGMIGLNAIKPKRKNMHIILAIIGLVMIIPYMVFMDSNLGTFNKDVEIEEEEPVAIEWDSYALSKVLPQPEQTKGEISEDSSEELRLCVIPATVEDFNNYYERCKEMGFTIDEFKNSDTDVTVFNKEGYRLHLKMYSSDDSDLWIDLEAPIKMGEIEWSNVGVAKRVPEPDSNIGKVTCDADDCYTVYIGDTSEADYNAYVKKCQKKGFDIDYGKEERYFSAENKKGDDLSVEYYGNNIMYIEVANWDLDD